MTRTPTVVVPAEEPPRERTSPAPPTPESPRPWSLGLAVTTALTLLGLVAVLAIAPAAAFTASRLPAPLSEGRVQTPAGELAPTSSIREVPVGLPKGAQVQEVADLAPFASPALGPAVAARLLGLLATAESGADWPYESPASYDYPYHFTAVDELLRSASQSDLTAHGAALGGALVLFAAQRDTASPVADGASRLAFAVLERARRSGGCDPQLNLLALMASDTDADDAVVTAEFAKAERACPNDPTPGWVFAQYRMSDVFGETGSTHLEEDQIESLDAGEAAAAALVSRFPSDPGALATLGDAYVMRGQALATAQPFTARRAFADAQVLFSRVRRESREVLAGELGEARAHVGLGRYSSAAELAPRAVGASSHPGTALRVAVRAAEGAHDFPAASVLARRLANLGTSAFPPATAIIPLNAPLSFGSDRLTPFLTTLLGGGQGGGGGTVADEGFIPVFREDELTSSGESCPDWAWRRAAFLAGKPAAALEGWPAHFTPVDPLRFAWDCPDGAALKRQIDSRLAGTLPTDLESATARRDVESLLDARQNLLRWAGDLAGARREALTWAGHLGDDTALAHQRLGEIDYLQKDFNSAARHFAGAAMRWRTLADGGDLAVDRALLAQGASLLRAGRGAEAVPVLRPLVLEGAQGYGYQLTLDDGYDAAQDFATLSYYASTLLAEHELAQGGDAASRDDFTSALSWAGPLEGEVHLGTVQNSAAIAALNTGDRAGALALSRAAVESDPRSPVYLMTFAEVARQNGDVDNAIKQNRAALESDPTTYPAANNLAVLLARQGKFTEASRVLRGAVSAAPTYALGWHNLGVVEGRRGPLHVLASQGALARAVSLDESYRNRSSATELDTTTYRTQLDVSKPLPKGWSFAESQRKGPALTVGLLAVALAGVGLLSLRGSGPSSGTRDWLDSLGSRPGLMPGARRVRRARWSVLATLAAFLLAFWRVPLWPWTGITYTLGLFALVSTCMVARSLVGRRRRIRGVVQGTWAPGVLVGLVSGAFGSPFAPLPVVRAPVKDTRVAIAGPMALALVSAVLLAEAVLLYTPLTTSLCLAAFIMAASLLLPVMPLDGARAGRAGIVGAAGLLGAVLLLGLGLV